jgi:hypothetical protein
MVEEHVHGETVWVAVRARGADWSWLTPDEAARIGRQWIEKYAPASAAAEWIGRHHSSGKKRVAGAPIMAPKKR